MTAATDTAPAMARPMPAARPIFVAAIGLSAFVFFSLQLLAGRLVLPVFGGSAGVWTTALSFFTAVLFVGYGYAHLVATRLSPRTGGLVHLAVAVVAVLAAAVAPADVASLRLAGVPEAVAVIIALIGLVGPPALLLSATTPLLSAWYSRHSSDPWWLYAASNAASFAALFAYPLLIEPLLPLSVQRLALTLSLGLFSLLLVAVVSIGRVAASPSRRASDGQPHSAATRSTTTPASATRLSSRRQLVWLAAAFVPAGLLSATTNFITTDLVSAPLLWVGPLAVYLASFVVAFSARGRRILPAAALLVPAAATFLWLPYVPRIAWPALPLLLIELVGFAVLAVVIHGRLAQDRPAEAHLTRFYLIIAAGGMLATAFVALLAPLLFPAIWEYPILLVAALLLLAVMRGPATATATTDRRPPMRAAARRLAPYVPAAIIVIALTAWQSPAQLGVVSALVALGGAVVALSLTPTLLAVATGVLVSILTVAISTTPLSQQRTFYGVIEARQTDAGVAMYHGTTLHGVQLPDRPDEPTSYYAASGPVGDLIDDLRQRTDGAHMGLVGLGVGTIAAYAQPDDRLTYFEIDQGVVDLARDERYFTFLARARGPVEVVVDDGRLALARHPSASFDLLVLDAFSSDSVPAHLLTVEAIEIYLRTLRPDGLIAFHVSNRYYDLAPAVAATARSLGLSAVGTDYNPTDQDAQQLAASGSLWVAVGSREATERLALQGWTDVPDGPILTDDFPDVMRLFRVR
jgi:SAM-dependent methyltransferase